MGERSNTAEDRLAELREEQHEDYKKARSSLLLIGLPVFVGLVAFVWFLPKLIGSDTDELRLEQALAYCNHSENKAVCEHRVTQRHHVCVEREKRDERLTADVYGECMDQEFENFYLEIGRNLPRPQ